MLDHNISALPVVDAEGDLKGLVSEGDLMRRVRETDGPRRSWWLEVLGGSGDAARDFVKLKSHRVEDVMTRDVVSVEEDTNVAEIARLLEKHRIKRVPVVRSDKVVGIVSRANLLHALSALLRWQCTCRYKSRTFGAPEPRHIACRIGIDRMPVDQQRAKARCIPALVFAFHRYAAPWALCGGNRVS